MLSLPFAFTKSTGFWGNISSPARSALLTATGGFAALENPAEKRDARPRGTNCFTPTALRGGQKPQRSAGESLLCSRSAWPSPTEKCV